MAAYAGHLPVVLLTGALGSGKTTLLNRMLRDPALKDAAVLINEFGEVGLDHYLVERIDETTVVLQSGCICCTIRGDLKDSMLALHGRRARGEIPPYRRMVIETTGLADPSPILFTLMSEPALRHHYRLASVITTVDAVHGSAQLDRQEEVVKQAAVADRIVLTKTDIAAADAARRLRARLVRLNPSAALSVANMGETDVGALLSADIYDPAIKGSEVQGWLAAEAAAKSGHAHDVDVSRHDADIHSFCLSFDSPLDWTAFGVWLTMLVHNHGQDVLRVKGVLNVAGVKQPVAINAVQHIVHPPLHLDGWSEADRRSRIVFIVRGLSRVRIEESLAAFNRLAA